MKIIAVLLALTFLVPMIGFAQELDLSIPLDAGVKSDSFPTAPAPDLPLTWVDKYVTAIPIALFVVLFLDVLDRMDEPFDPYEPPANIKPGKGKGRNDNGNN